MIVYRNQSVLDFKEHAIIVHGVNCQGKMNSGVAKAIREAFPVVYEEYMKLYNNKYHGGTVDGQTWSRFLDSNRNDPLLGMAQVVRVGETLHVGNLFTQQFYGRDGKKYADQNSIFNSLMNLCHAINVSGNLPRDIALPKIGCGLGGLDWDSDVLPVLEEVNRQYPALYTVCSI